MVEIAARAEVSPATLFNYFPTKADLAAAWVRGEVASALEQALVEGGRTGAGARGLRPVLRGLCRALARTSAEDVGARREAWSLTGRWSGLGVGAGAEAWVEKLSGEQAAGRIRADVSAETLTSLLVMALESGLVEGLGPGADDAEPVTPQVVADRLASALLTRVDLVLDGARKKNERVPLGASTPR